MILDRADTPEGIDDSKALAPERREELCSAILARAIAVGIGFASPAEIDRVNIRQPTFTAMRRAVGALSTRPHHALVDGKDAPTGLHCPIQMVIKGDALSLSIAAASIVAKVMRDRVMVRLHGVHPHYGFAVHKGYATAAHRAALRLHGPSPFHRLSFSSASFRETEASQ